MWKYKVIILAETQQAQQGQIDELGKDSWELVCVSDGLAYFKAIAEREWVSCKCAEVAECSC